MEQKIKRPKSPEQALASLMRLCSRAERSEGDALRLMRGWGVADADARKVLQRLVSERFIDDSRYAEAFVRDKSRLAGWGAYKIAAALHRKGVNRAIVEQALQQIDDTRSQERLKELLARKMRSVKAASSAEMRAKLLRYGLGRGFDYSQVRECVEQLVSDVD